jgi:hypothetical protein
MLFKGGAMTASFSREKELESFGLYPHVEDYYGYPHNDIPILNTPISPKENAKRYLGGGEYEWIPDSYNDIYDITPKVNPDHESGDFSGGIDCLGVEWVPVESKPDLPAFVKPGNPKLCDISEWQRVLQFPDVESWNWKSAQAEYAGSLAAGRFNRGVLLSGFFERLISLMDFENAAVAMLEEPDTVRAFFEKLADLNIDIMEHYVTYFDLDGILLHDDWASQKAPFFSLEVGMEIIVPPYKRFVERAHELGLFVTTHCCGNAVDRIPMMLEIGTDTYQMQDTAANPATAVRKGDGALKFEIAPMAQGGSLEEIEEYLYNLHRELGPDVMISTMDPETYEVTPELYRALYSASRRYTCDRDDAPIVD